MTWTTSLRIKIDGDHSIHTSTSQLALTETGGTEDTRLLYYSFEAAAAAAAARRTAGEDMKENYYY